MKKLFLIMLLLFAIQITNAQAHQMGANYNCKLQKGSFNTEKHYCAACAAKDKKEQDAKIAEDKRRNDVEMAKAKAEKEAKEKARLEKLAEEKKNAESGKVYINAQKNTVATSSSVQPKLAKNVTDSTIMVAIYNSSTLVQGFENEKKEILVKNNEWKATKTFSEISMTVNCPKNLGVVQLGYFNTSKDYTYHYDLVNSKGEYLFNDKSISDFYYLNDGWLLIKYFDNPNPTLYNLNTKNKIIIENISIYAKPQLNYSTNAYEKKHWILLYTFLPIFAENIALGNWIDQMSNRSKMAKNNLFKWASSKINEEILSKYSFALINTNSYAEYLNSGKTNFDNSNVILYCLTKKGELEVINLK
jgi:hypothetical protein